MEAFLKYVCVCVLTYSKSSLPEVKKFLSAKNSCTRDEQRRKENINEYYMNEGENLKASDIE